jgi:hypothetical protein
MKLMKSFLIVSIILWYLLSIGGDLPFDVISYWFVLWPMHCVLSLILPLGFGISVLKLKQIYYGFLFLFMFVFNLVFIGMDLANLSIASNGVAETYSNAIPSEVSIAALNDSRSEMRTLFARLIYTDLGQTIMYKNENSELVLYSPTKEDKEKLSNRLLMEEQAKEISQQIFDKSRYLFYLQIWHSVMFTIVVISFSLFWEFRANKPINKHQ